MNVNELSGWLELDEETDHWVRKNAAGEPIVVLKRGTTGWLSWSVVVVNPNADPRVVHIIGSHTSAHAWLEPAKRHADALAERVGWVLL